MTARARLGALLAVAVAAAPGAAVSAADAPVAEGFRAEGSNYVSVASALGSNSQEAEEKARGAALRGLFAGLGKDRLFAEVFTASPPLSLSIQVLASSKLASGYKTIVRLVIDDESVRIVERGPYMAAAVGILDRAEAGSDEADARRASAAAAEADLGAALDRYGMAIDACHVALELIDPVADPGIFSTKGKRTAPELKKILASTIADASAGVERVKKAEAALAEDESGAAAIGVADAAIAAADQAQALLDEIAPVLGDVSAYGEERLSPLRDRISTQRSGLSDSGAALDRAQAALPRGNGGFAGDKLDFARRRLDTADASLAAAYKTVDREIRDPAVRRAARAQALRWALYHEPREYVSLRGYLPFKLGGSEGALTGSPLDADANLEGAFAFGSGGVWVRSQAKLSDTDLEPGEAGGDEVAFTQSFDFGVWGKSLYFAGYRWDWLRRVDGASFPKAGAVELGLGGVYEHGASTERFRRADWLLSLSYELPYPTSDSPLWNVLNAGLDAQFRLGDLALLEASVSKRLDQLSDAGSLPQYVSVLHWSLDVGLRLPPPFSYGVEYFGDYVQPMKGDGTLGSATNFDGGHFRFFVQYSL
jgi:hypothetical protein